MVGDRRRRRIALCSLTATAVSAATDSLGGLPDAFLPDINKSNIVISNVNKNLKQPRIIGGDQTTRDRFPYVASLVDTLTGRHVCGGSLIAPDIILTAGHCSGHFNAIQVGRHSINDGELEAVLLNNDGIVSDNNNNEEGEAVGDMVEDLFDSREFLQRKREKQLEDQSKVGKPSSVIPTKTKIKRSDVKAYTKLLEMDPLADEDSSYFEDEDGIDIISALLGDVEPGVGDDTDEVTNKSGKRVQKKTSFLGIGSGPLQVGHFIGALGVVLMAFVEYPGFPLTNLPTPLRGALQGGLATIYGVNLVLAVIAALSAPGRNQPAVLWGAKTFAVGGIAYDQLMQIPTPEELEERARKEAEMMKLRGRGRRGGRRQ